MAHNITENDQMVSVRETPWHGLGIILPDYVPVKEAQRLSELTWRAEKRPVMFGEEFGNSFFTMEDQYVLVRDDKNIGLGIVGSRYVPYQNDEMFDFMERFVAMSGSKLETCGSLLGGRITWALASAQDTFEVLSGDPINKFFLFKNSFDGKSSLEICFTNVRVVCNNTLNFALDHCPNVFQVKHLSTMKDKIASIEASLALRQKYDEKLKESFQVLASKQVNERFCKDALVTVFRKKADENKTDTQVEEDNKDKIESVMELVENGAGTEIPGVRGSAYGLVQAFGEYCDHFGSFYTNPRRSSKESRFKSIMFGKTQLKKQNMFDYVFANAA